MLFSFAFLALPTTASAADLHPCANVEGALCGSLRDRPGTLATATGTIDGSSVDGAFLAP